MNSGKTKNKKDDSNEVYSHMLEMYTVVPPPPLAMRRKRRSALKKAKKISHRKPL